MRIQTKTNRTVNRTWGKDQISGSVAFIRQAPHYKPQKQSETHTVFPEQ